MLKNLHQVIIILVFSLLLRDVLTKASLIFVFFGVGIILLKIKMNSIIRNALALGVFSSYWFTYGKIIDPEVGLNFLTTVTMLKMLERESIRDEYMIFFGLLLLVSAGSLFEKNLTYVFFFTLSFIFLLKNLYLFLGQKLRPKEIFHLLLWVFPLTFLLFFLIPRLLQPIPFQQNTTRPGEVGYTPDVIISEIENLEPNSSPVFNVVLSKKVSGTDLYWRGNTLSYNDGWNWKEMVQDRQELKTLVSFDESKGIHQKIRLFTRSNYFITLDYPRSLKFSATTADLTGPKRTLTQHTWEWAQNYEATSFLTDRITDSEIPKHYLNVNLPRKSREEIKKMFPGASAQEIADSIKHYFRDQKFVYTLSPGRSEGLWDFFEMKKGFCSHFASATAIIFRTKGIPSRLVSGFMGGTYNPFADFYLVTQNDAHVWVEIFTDGIWKRVDPTGWIVPERLNLGGSAYIEGAQADLIRKAYGGQAFKFIIAARMWFEHLDFKFYQWLEKMNYEQQESILARFNFSRRWTLTIIPIILALFILGYLLFLHFASPSTPLWPHHELWTLFFKKMEKKGIFLSTVSLKECSHQIQQGDNKSAQEVLELLVRMTFGEESVSTTDIKKKIKKL
jgi:hypothetical protein